MFLSFETDSISRWCPNYVFNYDWDFFKKFPRCQKNRPRRGY